MRGDRYARHSAIVEVESDTDKNIEQSQACGGRMFPAHTQAGKKADRSRMAAKNAEKGLFFSSFSDRSVREMCCGAISWQEQHNNKKNKLKKQFRWVALFGLGKVVKEVAASILFAQKDRL